MFILCRRTRQNILYSNVLYLVRNKCIIIFIGENTFKRRNNCIEYFYERTMNHEMDNVMLCKKKLNKQNQCLESVIEFLTIKLHLRYDIYLTQSIFWHYKCYTIYFFFNDDAISDIITLLR
jgi:hypothetical protein